MRTLSLVLCGALCGWSGSAAGQTEAATPGPETPAATMEAEPPAEAAPDPSLAEAMERFADARALFERGDASAALAEMQRVFELLEGSPNQYVVLYNLGRVYEELHRYDRAIELYERYLREAPPEGADRADAEASLRALERLLGTLVITSNVEAEVWIGDALVGTAPGSIRVSAGAHAVELRAAGYEAARREVEVAARTEVALEMNLAQLSDFRGVSPTLFVLSASAAAVALGLGVGLGVHALSLRDGAIACGMTPRCTLDEAGRRREIAEFALSADVLYGAAGLFAITSVILLFVTDWGGTPEAAPTAWMLPVVSEREVGIVLGGTL